jgi:hypothetical protein
LKSPNNKYLKFLRRFVSIILIVTLSDFIIGNLLRHYYFKQIAGEGYRTTYAMDSTTADILVFGSSRANHHYVPKIFEDGLKMTFYNTGRDGNFLLYNYAVFKAIMKRYKPKIVIFDLNPDELYYDEASNDRLSSLLPYYRNHPEIRDIVNLKSPYEKIKLISSIYPFNSNLLTIGIGNMKLNKQRKSDRKGYIPLKNIMIDNTLYSISGLQGVPDKNKMNALHYIMNYCIDQNIRLFVIQSPIFACIKPLKINDIVEQMAKRNKTEFWSFSNDSNFLRSPGYFQDQNHLNEIGANCFSQIVVNRIIEKDFTYPYKLTNKSNSLQ